MKRKNSTNPINLSSLEVEDNEQLPQLQLSAQSEPSDGLKDIRKIVVLMLENRGFDHVMGWLYDKSEDLLLNKLPSGVKGSFVGLSTLDSLEALSNPYPGLSGSVQPTKGARSPKTPSYNPGEHFVHIFEQMWGPSDDAINQLTQNQGEVAHSVKVSFWQDKEKRAQLIRQIQNQSGSYAPLMRGYVSDYKDEILHGKYTLPSSSNDKRDVLSEILDTYTREQLPVLSGLARHYAISDQWFCSVPSQTNTNRAFSVAGTSRGLATNSYYDAYRYSKNPELRIIANHAGGTHADKMPWFTRSLFSILLDNDPRTNDEPGWKVYWQGDWPLKLMSLAAGGQYHRVMLPYLNESKYNDRFVKIDPFSNDNQLFEDARNGRLPKLSWIEPKWGGGSSWKAKMRLLGTDMHPVSDTAVAESFVHDLYTALSEGPDWDDTLFVITFDENGGTYDHVAPPEALPSGRERAPYPFDGDIADTMDRQTRTQFGYDFKSFGVRVPTLFISPRIKKHTLLRSNTEIPFDHTSIIATILDWWGVDRQEWDLGPRTMHAPTFAHVVSEDLMRKDRKYSDSLNVARGTGVELDYDTDYYLEYVGSAWPQVPDTKRYLGPMRQGMIQRNYYPTLVTDKHSAVKVRLSSPNGKQGNVSNMDLLRLATGEQDVGQYKYLGAFTDTYLYYYKSGTRYDTDLLWEIRMLTSRDNRDKPQVGELVQFVSQHKRSMVSNISELTIQDVPQRMAAATEDDGSFPNPTYLTSRAGQWDLWRLVPAD